MKIKYLGAIAQDVKKIKDKKLKINIEDVLLQLKKSSSITELKGIKKLAGHPNAYRMRIGDYRLGFYLEGGTVILARFVKRNDIYKLFP